MNARALTSLPSAQVHRIHSRTPKQCCLCSAHWISEHNISVSGNPSQQVISSQWFIPNVWMSRREFPLIWSCLSWQTDVFTASYFLTKFVSATKAYKSFPPLCCLPGDNKIMNLNVKQSLSLLPSIAVFLIFPDTVILSSFVALNMNVSCTSHAVFSIGSVNPTVWKALGIWSKATVRVDFGSCVFQTAALSSFPKGVWGTEMRPCPGQDKDLSIDVKRARRQSKHQTL